MNTEVSMTAPTPDTTYGAGQQKPGVQVAGSIPAGEKPAHDPQDLRLVIEEDKAAGTYVYKTIDRRTGAIVRQLPREQILKLREQSQYAAGDVINAKA